MVFGAVTPNDVSFHGLSVIDIDINFYRHTVEDSVGRKRTRVNLKRSISIYHVGNATLQSDKSTQTFEIESQIQHLLNILKQSNNMLYLFIAKIYGLLDRSDTAKFKSLCMNIYLLSPQTYKFIKSCIPDLFSIETVYQYYKPRADILTKTLMYEREGTMLEHIRNIVTEKLGVYLKDRKFPILATLGGMLLL